MRCSLRSCARACAMRSGVRGGAGISPLSRASWKSSTSATGAFNHGIKEHRAETEALMSAQSQRAEERRKGCSKEKVSRQATSPHATLLNQAPPFAIEPTRRACAGAFGRRCLLMALCVNSLRCRNSTLLEAKRTFGEAVGCAGPTLMTRMYGPAVRCKKTSSGWRTVRSRINVSGL
jgi:hypothetical protein